MVENARVEEAPNMKSPPDLSDAEVKFARAKLAADELLTNIWAWTHDETDPAIRVGIER